MKKNSVFSLIFAIFSLVLVACGDDTNPNPPTDDGTVATTDGGTTPAPDADPNLPKCKLDTSASSVYAKLNIDSDSEAWRYLEIHLGCGTMDTRAENDFSSPPVVIFFTLPGGEKYQAQAAKCGGKTFTLQNPPKYLYAVCADGHSGSLKVTVLVASSSCNAQSADIPIVCSHITPI
jgi:hypothetical protein